MLIDANTTRKNLRPLLEREKTSCSFGTSRGLRQNFKAACKYEGFGKYTNVLEDLIGQVNDAYFKKSKKLKIEIEGFNDRAVSSISCDLPTLQTFKEGCNKNCLKMAHVLESMMQSYVFQIEKRHGIRITNGKVKK